MSPAPEDTLVVNHDERASTTVFLVSTEAIMMASTNSTILSTHMSGLVEDIGTLDVVAV